ncbi:LysR substrate-binding domain-containing protein [Desulfococcaceae bacterium HSG8]|nr:LysR substrate-binding domain-containing protein [Desulfococcaceae bacterium HSG8]
MSGQEKLVEDEMRLIIPSGHKWEGEKRITLKKLFCEPFIIRERGSGTLKSLRHSLSRAGHRIDDLNVTAEMGSTAAVIQGIKNNIGISILSTVAISEELQTGKLKALTIEHLDLKRNFYLTRHRYRTQSPLCQAFTEFLKRKA